MLEVKRAVYPSPEQWELTIHGMRNPYNSWSRTDSYICKGKEETGVKALEKECKWCPYSMWYLGDDLDELLSKNDREFHGCGSIGFFWEGFFRLGEKDKTLAKNLINSGVEHAKFLRQLPVVFDLKMPLFMWKQLDQYKIGTVTDSCSTMHCLTKEMFKLSDFCVQENSEDFYPRDYLWEIVCQLNDWRDIYLKTKDKRYWNAINEFLPQSYFQLRTWSANYAVLFNICAQRAGHPLKGWDEFIKWIVDNVPYFRELCFDKLYEQSKGFRELFKEVKE